ncbi:MAG: 4a-hydroxytetrahydrobiopterin dehydratase [Candidatus Omnitrophica bacterium]|nr:4a-hydroxytetrahydrobiopterin dehydratase [Candidatus Omnitrophota bacterium]
MTTLANKKCESCEGKTKPLSRNEAEAIMKDVAGWQLTEDARGLYREYSTKNFMAAVGFINKIAAIAEGEDHHPDLRLTGYRKLRIDLSTHAIGGLSENDFILAAKINEVPVELKTDV